MLSMFFIAFSTSFKKLAVKGAIKGIFSPLPPPRKPKFSHYPVGKLILPSHLLARLKSAAFCKSCC